MEGNYSHKQGIAWDYLQKYGYLKKRVSIGLMHTAVILHDGTARACVQSGEMQNYDMSDWSDLKEIATCGVVLGTMGLRHDGRIYYVARMNDVESPVSYWPSNIKTLADSGSHILGLTEDGKVVAFSGGGDRAECDVGDWSDIVEINAAVGISAGVRKNGTAVVCGNDAIEAQVASWKNIEHIYCGDKNLVVGLQFDGRVVVASTKHEFSVSHWKDVIDISCGSSVIAGIQGNGHLYLTADDDGLDNIYTMCVQARRFSEDTIVALSTDHRAWVGDIEDGFTIYGNESTMEMWFGFVASSVMIDANGHIEINYDETDTGSGSPDWQLFTEPFDMSVYATAPTPTPPQTSQTSQTSQTMTKSGGCYVATCVYGSYDCPEVWTLRRFRDDTLGATWYGRAFIRAYYAISPTLVKWFGTTKWFHKLFREPLNYLVEKLHAKGVENTPYEDKDW